MSRIVVDAGDLERVARRLGQAGADLDETAGHVAAAVVRLPPPLSALCDDAGRTIGRGLQAQAGALLRLAGEVRLVARAARLAEAGGFDPRLATMAAAGLVGPLTGRDRDGRRRFRPHFPPPPEPAARPEPADEEILRSLREQAAWRIVASPGGLLRLQLSSAAGVGTRRGSGAAGGLAVAGIALVALAFAKALGEGAGTASVSPAPVPTATPSNRCDAEPPGRQVDAAKNVLLDPAHIDAVKRELKGEVVARKSNGTPYDHVQEYREQQNRVKNQIAKLKGIIASGRCSPEDRAAARRELSEASSLLDWTDKNVLPEK